MITTFSPPDQLPDSLSIVVKVAERCNIACTYCYFFFAGDDTYLKHPAVIPSTEVDRMCDLISDAVGTMGIRDLRVGFHGGEPLLLKKHRFAEICECVTNRVSGRCRLTFALQTNAMLVDDEWIEIFERYAVRVGVSFDGPEEIHDIARLDKKGRGTYRASEEGWLRLKAAAEAGRIGLPGVLCVVNPERSGEDIFLHFARNLGSRSINFLLPDISHDAEEANPVFVRRCGEYLIDVFNAWLSLGDSEIRVRFITEIFGPLLNDQYCARSVHSKNSPLSQLVVSSNGEISPDDTIRGLDERFRDVPLNVARHGLAEVWSSDLWRELEQAHRTRPDACNGCRWWNACKAGTVHHRFSRASQFNNASVFCEALQMIHAHVFDHLVDAGFDAEEMQRRMAWRPDDNQPLIAA